MDISNALTVITRYGQIGTEGSLHIGVNYSTKSTDIGHAACLMGLGRKAGLIRQGKPREGKIKKLHKNYTTDYSNKLDTNLTKWYIIDNCIVCPGDDII